MGSRILTEVVTIQARHLKPSDVIRTPPGPRAAYRSEWSAIYSIHRTDDHEVEEWLRTQFIWEDLGEHYVLVRVAWDQRAQPAKPDGKVWRIEYGKRYRGGGDSRDWKVGGCNDGDDDWLVLHENDLVEIQLAHSAHYSTVRPIDEVGLPEWDEEDE